MKLKIDSGILPIGEWAGRQGTGLLNLGPQGLAGSTPALSASKFFFSWWGARAV
jgi:hypothetical protein